MAPKTLLPVAAIVATALAQSSGGCGAQPTLTSGIHNIGDRQYTLKIPENYDSANPYRLVFGFHWLSGSMGDVVNGNSVPVWYGLEALAEGTAIFVADLAARSAPGGPGPDAVAGGQVTDRAPHDPDVGTAQGTSPADDQAE